MDNAKLDPAEALLGALTRTALKHLGVDTAVIDADGQLRKWRTLRLDDVALVDMPADDSGLRCINCYEVEVENFDAIDGKRFKLDDARLLYSLRWLHKTEPPDYDLVLVKNEPPWWVNTANLTLLGELRRRAPHSINWGPLFAQGVVQMLDDFEAATGQSALGLRDGGGVEVARRGRRRRSLPVLWRILG